MLNINNRIYDAIERSRQGLSTIADIASQLKTIKTTGKKQPITIPKGALRPEQRDFLLSEIHHSRTYLDDIPKNPAKWHQAIDELVQFREDARQLLSNLAHSIKESGKFIATQATRITVPDEETRLALAHAS